MDKTETKEVYAYAADGKLLGKRTLDYTDRSPVSGRWQIPANMTEIAPPAAKDGYDIVFDGVSWKYVEAEKEEDTKEPEMQEPTAADKISQLDSQYEQDKKTLQSYYVDFLIAGDTEGMESVKAELDALAEQYDSDLAALKGDDE